MQDSTSSNKQKLEKNTLKIRWVFTLYIIQWNFYWAIIRYPVLFEKKFGDLTVSSL